MRTFSTLLGDHTGRIVWKSDAISAPIFRLISAQRPEAEHPIDMLVSHVRRAVLTNDVVFTIARINRASARETHREGTRTRRVV